MEGKMDRRAFLRGASLSTLGIMGASALAGCAASNLPATGEVTFDQLVTWDDEYDVIVIGFGGAGAVASKTAADVGAKVLLLEKAEKGDEGGNTRFCSQMFAYGHEDEEATKAYYRAMASDMPMPDDVLEVYATGIAHLHDNYSETYGLDKSEFVTMPVPVEYPEFAGSDKITLDALHMGAADGYMWGIQRDAVMALSDSIDVWYESPAVRLVQDPWSKTVVGVTVDHEGEEQNIRALRGVILTCGGFENNVEMVKDYLGFAHYLPLGTLNNTGDGIKLALGVGADLWHMHAAESLHVLGGLSWITEEGMRGIMVPVTSGINTGSMVLVGADGYRYLREDEVTRHGHVYNNGIWTPVRHPERMFVVYDQAQLDDMKKVGEAGAPEEFLAQAHTASSFEELATLIDVKPEVLMQTMADFNKAAAEGYDPAFHRAPESMRVFGEPPYYALELIPDILNTQGGPRRNGKAEVIDVEGNPIPHLYAAGECGGVTSHMYQGGGNMADNMIFGQVAGRNAAAEKEALAPIPVSIS